MSDSPRFPVSVKGVILAAPGVLLLENERGEWELPGGKLEPGETPEACLVREVREEVGLAVTVGPLLDVWVYRVAGAEVLVVTYGCHAATDAGARCGPEHRSLSFVALDRLDGVPMPEGYRHAVHAWAARLAAGARDESARRSARGVC